MLFTGVCDKNKMLNGERGFILTENRFLMSQSGLTDKPRQAYCLCCTRATLISIEEGISLVCRNTFYLDSLNINDLTLPNSTLTRPLCILMIFLDLTRHLLDSNKD